MVRRTGLVTVVALVGVITLGACDPVNPPVVGPRTEGPVTYGPDPGPDVVATASEGGHRAVVWGDSDDDLRFDRFNDSTTPVAAAPVTIADETASFITSLNWGNAAVSLGNGFALMAADNFESGPHGHDVRAKSIDLRNPQDAQVPLSGVSLSDLTWCGEPDFFLAATSLAWNGTTFLLSKDCRDSTQLFTVSSSGVVTPQGTLPGATDVSLASAGSGFLAAYETTNGAGNLDVRARRLSSTGVPIGTAVTVAGGAGDQLDPVAAGSGSAYLIAWSLTGNGPDLGLRTVQSDGALGTSRVLGTAGQQFQPALAGGGAGSWFAVWSEVVGDDADVVGSKVLPSGAPESSSGNTLAGGTGDQSAAQVTRAAGNAAFFTWFDGPRNGLKIDLTRKLDVDGFPFGPTIRSTRSPFAQACFDVAAGAGQYLVTWQETRVVGTNLYAQRYLPNGTPTGARITVSTAPRGQFCPTAAWSGTTWLVAWTDDRSGTKDVFGALVSGAGAVTPTAGFPISAGPSQQQSPSVAWNGTDFVVAWNDLRNGNQDIFAARVAPNRTVRDLNGIPVTTAAGIQRSPSAASAGGGTLIAWVGSDAQRAILRGDGTFLAGIVSEGPTASRATAVASPTRMGVLFAHQNPDVGEQVVVANINPANGAKQGLTVLDELVDGQHWVGGDISFDGTSFAYTSGAFFPESFVAHVGTITGDTVLTAQSRDEFVAGAPIASLPDQRSLIVGSIHGRIAVAPVDDAP